jgi:glucose-fructose oxidoreductase
MAYEYAEDITMEIAVGERNQRRTYKQGDQFGPELIYFSDCVLHDRPPEPSGEESLADIRVIEAIFKSARSGKAVKIQPVKKHKYPSRAQEISKPPVKEPSLVNAEPAAKD